MIYNILGTVLSAFNVFYHLILASYKMRADQFYVCITNSGSEKLSSDPN